MTFSGGARRVFGVNETVLQSESQLVIDWQGQQIFATSSDAIGFQAVLSGDIPDGQLRTITNKVVARKATQINVQIPYSRSLQKFWDWLNQNRGNAMPINLAEELDTGETTVFVNARVDDFQRSGHSTTGNDPRFLILKVSYDQLR